MPNQVFDFVEKSKDCKDIEELKKLLAKTLADLGFSQWAYETEIQRSQNVSEQVVLHQFPQDWIEHYLDKNYLEIDPVVIGGKQMKRPFVWNEAYKDLTPEQRAYLNEASSFGMDEGVAIPIARANGQKSIFSITGHESPADLERAIQNKQMQLISIACTFHAVATELLHQQPKTSKENPLTTREQECVAWSAEGKTTWEISQILNLAERTVIFHIDNARKKVGAANKCQLVVECIRHNFITA